MRPEGNTLRRQLLSRLGPAAGWAFCAMWAAAILAFPACKGVWTGYVPVVLGALVGTAACLPAAGTVLNRWVNRPRPAPFLIGVIALGFALRLLTLPLQPTELVSDPAVYQAKAVGLLSGEGFGPTAFVPPGMPFLLASWYSITGVHPRAGYVLGILLGTAAIPLAYAVGKRVLSRAAARWAALLTAVMPTLVFSSAAIHTTSLLVLIVLGTLLLALEAVRKESSAWWPVLGLGVLLGAGTLVKTIFLPVPILVFLSWLLLGAGRSAIYKSAAVAAVAACIVLPWTVRNYAVLGAFVPVSSNGGYVLYHGMNPAADGMWSAVLDSGGQGDELQRDRMARQAALNWMRGHPLQCARLMVRKQAFLWGTGSTNIAERFNPSLPAGWRRPLAAGIKFLINAGWTALLVLCVRSTRATPIWREPKLALGVLFLFYVFTSHLFFEVQSRYHIPVIPVLILIACSGLAGPAASEARPSLRRQPAQSLVA